VKRFALLSGTVALAAACSSAPPASTTATATGAQALAFAKSAHDNGVPRDLLVAIAKVEGGLDMPAFRTNLDPDAHVAAAGPLQLRRGRFDSLARGAALVEKSELDLRRDTDLALEAGARVLADLGGRLGARGDDLATWEPALEELSGYADDAHRKEYAHRVFATLARGGTFEGRDGEKLTILPRDVPPSLTIDLSSTLHALAGKPDYPDAEWIPTSCANKCDSGRDGAAVRFVVIHDTEGGWDASVATLQNDPGKSVQYIVGTDGRVAQFVSESDTAWHAGNYYYNQRSVGIEHVGYANKPFPSALYESSAKLVSYLTQKYNLPRDRAHVIGHDQIPDGGRISSSSAPCGDSPRDCTASGNYGGAANHSDPGVWEWATFMARIGGAAKCNDVTELWNCSNDKTHAFRCAAGLVEVDTCNAPEACEVQPNGKDDICHKAQATSSQPTPEPATPNPGPSRNPENGAAPPPPPPAPQDSGCSVTGKTGYQTSTAALSLLAAAALLARSRRARKK
jgi:N-acetyl-anhydromuramyl-L-alanine amidase AmpD